MSSATSRYSFAFFRADDKAALEHMRNNRDTTGTFENFFRNSLIGSAENLMQHLGCVVHSIDGIFVGCPGP